MGKKEKKEEGPPPTENPDAERCNFWLSPKKRFCKAERGKGPSGFCGAHRDDGSRVPCPLNPNHTILKSEIEKHIKICPDLRFIPDGKPYYLKGVNGRSSCREAATMKELPADLTGPPYPDLAKHQKLNPTELKELLAKIQSIYSTLVAPDIEDQFQYIPQRNDGNNDADDDGESEEDEHTPIDGDVVQSINNKIEVTTTSRKKEECKKTLNQVHSGHRTKKHTPQHRGLFYQMATIGLLPAQHFTPAYENLLSDAAADTAGPPVADYSNEAHVLPTVLLELGAGKAGLAMALREDVIEKMRMLKARLREEDTSSSGKAVEAVVADADLQALALATTVVVDRGSFRHKKDGCYSDSASPFARVKLDIQDLHLAGVEEIASIFSPSTSSPASGGGLAMGKHLCGGCTDFALNSVLLSPYQGGGSTTAGVKGIVIATCCHHSCDPLMVHNWAQVALHHSNSKSKEKIGTEGASSSSLRQKRNRTETNTLLASTLEAQGMLSKLLVADWACLVSLTSWGVCGDRVSAEQQELGRMAKRIIDWVRLQYVLTWDAHHPPVAGAATTAAGGWKGALRHFVPRNVTKENAALVLWRY